MSFKDIKQKIKDILPRTLFWRSLLILIVPVLLIQIITTYVFFDRHWQKMGDRLAVSVANEINLAAGMIESDDSDINVLYVRQLLEETLDISLMYERGVSLERSFKSSKWFEKSRAGEFYQPDSGQGLQAGSGKPGVSYLCAIR